jgi:ribosome-binding ATPase YchF (GTP1/OBG family)
MKLSIGIVGLPNVGKSTLFTILTKQNVTVANYPFATIDPNVGVVPVPDERLEVLTTLSSSKKMIPAVVEFYDIAGLVKGAYKGEGLGNQFLANIRECKAIVQVLRCFKDADIIHVEETTDPVRDLDIILTELIFKDLDTVTKRLEKCEKDVRTGDKKAQHDAEVLRAVKTALEGGNLSKVFAHESIVKELSLLTAKEQIFLLNGEEEDVPLELKEKIAELGGQYLTMNLGLADDVSPIIVKAYEALHLISFLTTGEDETRAWTIERGAKAPEAAGAIHTDFEHKFIRAEVVNYKKLVEAGGWNQAKQKGWLRLEGKEYVVEDGDVMVIRHG